jgi:signal transduction histidine kinase
MGRQDRAAPAVRRGGVAARLSLEKKLPLLIGGLLLAVVVAMAAAAYFEMRQVTLAAADNRQQSVANQFRDLFAQMAQRSRAAASTIAARPEIRAYAAAQRAGDRDTARAILRFAGAQDIVTNELRDSLGRVLIGSNPDAATDTIAIGPLRAARDSVWTGAFRRLRDTTVYAVVAPVPGTSVRLVQWRRFVASARERGDLTRLIGSDALMFLGNRDSSLWTDLDRPVTAVPATAHTVSVPGTPWSLAVEFPRGPLMAPVRTFLWQLVIIAAVALVVGLAATWFASRRITTPIRRLTAAADTIAKGDLSAALHIERSDEIGQLADAFATMAAEVMNTRRGLEARVEERTQELSAAMGQLHDAQDALVRREKLAMLGQLAGGVGHELRNPLGVMTNAVYYLKAVLPAAQPTVHEYLDILQQQITLSEKIVGDLLDFARSKPPQRALVSLGEVTSALIARLGATNGVKIESYVWPDTPAVFADRVQIGQVVLNLLTNAVQAIDGPGTVTVRVGHDGREAHVEIADSGRGVPEENIDKIFEPLFTTKARGIGLGLAVSRTLARSNAGDLTVRSPRGEGATFRLTIPITGAPV